MRALRTISQILTKLADPAPIALANKMERKIQFYKNRFMIGMQVSLMLVYIFAIYFIKGIPGYFHVLTLGYILYQLAITLLFCRSRLGLLKFLYTFGLIIYHPLFSSADPNGALPAFMAGGIFPGLIMSITGSKICMVSVAGFQSIFFLTFYKSAIIEMLKDKSPEDFAEALVALALLVNIFQCVLLIANHQLFKKSQAEVFEISKREIILTHQKKLFLTFSHEVRNPLNALISNVKLALNEKLPATFETYLNTANACAEILLQLVNNILDKAKSEVEKLEVAPQSTEIHKDLQKIWEICSTIIKCKNLSGKMQISPKMPKIMKVDMHRLNQMILNLIVNATKFTEQGSIHLTLDWISGLTHVTERCFEPQPYDDENEGIFEKDINLCSIVRTPTPSTLCSLRETHRESMGSDNSLPTSRGILKVIVRDTGSGIEEKTLDSLFKEFSQGNEDQNKKKIGTGLGLYITKEICENMNGEIRVYSKVGIGSTFIFCVPVSI